MCIFSWWVEGQTGQPSATSIDVQYDSALKEYVVVDPVTAKLVVDERGNPFSVDASSALPREIVRTISRSTFSPRTNNGTPVAFETSATVSMRRPVSDFEIIAARPYSGNVDGVQKAVEEGAKLKPSSAAALEKKLKDDKESANPRISLAVYASANEGLEIRQLHTRQIAWFVRNVPGADFLGRSAAMLFPTEGPFQNKEGYGEVRMLWLQKLSEKPDDPAILSHAAFFLRISDPETAERLLLPAVSKVGGASTWLGELYALSALGVTSLDYKTGQPASAGSRLPDSGFGRKAQVELATKPDPRVVISALTVVSSAGRSLAEKKALPEGFVDFCQSLLVRAKTFYPEVELNCDRGTEPEVKVKQSRLTKRVMPLYPPEARIQGIQGVVALEATIGKDGKLSSIGLLKGPLILFGAAYEAVSQWEYTPMLVDGKPVEVITTITVNFRFNG